MAEIHITNQEILEDALRSKQDPSWEVARNYANILGRPPSLFSSCIRAINKVESILDPIDHTSVRDLALSSSEFLLRISPTLQSVFYHAALALHPEEVKDPEKPSIRGLLAIFSVREVASIIGLTYLFKRCQKRCDPSEWQVLNRRIHTQMEIAALLGAKMSYVGVGNGILLGAIRYLSMATFAMKDPAQYAEFRRHTRPKNALFDLKSEETRFGCNHLQVGSFLVQGLGYCMPRSTMSMNLGMDAIAAQPDTLPPGHRQHLLSLRAALTYIESFHGTGESPANISVDYELRLPEEEWRSLKERVWLIIREGPSFDWLNRTGADLPENWRKRTTQSASPPSSGRSRRKKSNDEVFDHDTFS